MLIGLRTIRNAFNNSGFDKPTIFAASGNFNGVAAAKNLATFFFGQVDTAKDLFKMLLRNDRAKVGVVVVWVADLQLFDSGHKVITEFFVD